MKLLINPRFATLTVLAGLGRFQVAMTPVALLAAGLSAGFSPEASSALGAAVLFAGALSATPKGKLVDRYGYRLVAWQSLLLGAAFVWTIFALLELPWIFVLLGALLLGLVRTNSGALQNSLWSQHHSDSIILQRTLAMENMAGFIVQTLSPLLVGLCLLLAGGVTALLVTALLASCSMFLWGMLAPSVETKESSDPSSSVSGLRLVAFMSFAVSLSIGLTQGLLLQSGGALGAFQIAAFTVGAASASVFLMIQGFQREKIRRWILPVVPLFFVPLFALTGTGLVWLALPLAGAVSAAGSVAANSRVRDIVSSRNRAAGFSFVLSANITGVGSGILLAGFLMALPWQPLVLLALLALALCSLLGESGFWRSAESALQVQPS